MSTSEDLDDMLFDEETYEKAKFCLMADTTSEESYSNLDVVVNFDDLKSLKLAYHDLFFNSSMLSKAYKNPMKGSSRYQSLNLT